MKALLICPDPRPAVALLAESCPLALAPLLGKCLVEYWIEHLVALGAQEIFIVASDRAEQVKARVHDGTRWGLPIAVAAAERELSADQASEKYYAYPDTLPEMALRMDHLPGLEGVDLFESYAAWFAGLQAWMPQAQALERIGQCEVQPGVWIGLRTRIDPGAKLVAPCWLGDYVQVGAAAVIGPHAILEQGVVVAAGACVARSVIGPSTFVGAHTRIESSIADRHTLIDWGNNSCLRVPDPSWLSSLSAPFAATRPDLPLKPVKIENRSGKLSVSELDELSVANSRHFREKVRAAFSPSITIVEVDLSRTRYVDSCGLATLCALHRSVGVLGASLRLLNPEPSVRQLLELTQLREVFEIGRTELACQRTPKPAARRFMPAPISWRQHTSVPIL